jgi:hypothetical protein
MHMDISTLADHGRHHSPNGNTISQKSKDMRFCDVYARILVEGVRGMFENCNPRKEMCVLSVKFVTSEFLEYVVCSVRDHIEQ